jgi:malate dehydrogenase
VRLGRDGAEGVLPLGPLSVHERAGFAKMLPELKGSIEKGVRFANQ